MYRRKDLLGLRDASKENILSILKAAVFMKEIVEDPSKRCNSLKHISIATLFYENSTRTKMSFKLAGDYVGATVTDLGISTSSVSKGESLIDTAVTLDQMGLDLMIIRHQMTGAPHLVAKNVKSSIINAGDGTNEHPTQALLDLFTIYERKGTFDGLKVAIIGDIAHSRVARSNVFGLKTLGAHVMLAGPSTLIANGMKSLGAEVTTNVKQAVKDADVVMGLRVQLERKMAGAFPNLREYASIFGVNGDTMSYAKSDVLIMHPGPVNRGIELSTDVIDGKNSLINIQVKNGVAVRMAVLKQLYEARRG